MTGGGTGPTVVIVGTAFGCQVHLPALRAAGFEVVGLVGADPDRTARRAERYGVARSFTDLDEAITRTGAAAVTIATPPHAHAPLVLQALGRGRHVLCEKPFARDALEARRMLDAAERAGVTHVLGHEFRWLPQRVVAAQALADGLIGEPRVINFSMFIRFVGDPRVTLPSWWLDRDAGGGWLGAWGSHVVDWVRTWAGEFNSVSATLPSVAAPDGGAEDSYLVRFRLASGAEGVLSQVAGAWGPSATMVRVAGTRGTLWLEDDVAWIADAQGERELAIASDLMPPLKPLADDVIARLNDYSSYEFAPYRRLCETWRDLIENRAPATAVAPATFADGLAEMEVLDAIRASAAAGGAAVVVHRS